MTEEKIRERIRREENRITYLTRISASLYNDERVANEFEIEDLEQDIEELEQKLSKI